MRTATDLTDYAFLACVVLAACAAEPETGGSATASGSESPPLRIIEQASGVTSSLRGVAVGDDHTVWVTGTDGTVLRSVDAGETWELRAPPGSASLDFRDVEVLDGETVLLMSAGSGSSSRIFKTTDAGSTWRLVYENAEESAFFNGFAFRDERSGILTSDPIDGKLLLLVTGDGGETWRRTGQESLPPLLEGEYGFAASGTGIATFGDRHVWVATGGAVARVFRSLDAGRSWEVSETPVGAGTASSGIFSIAFRDPGHGVVVGGDYQEPELDRGNAAWSADGGRSWTLAASEAPLPQKAAVAHLGDRRYLAAGRTGLAYSGDDGRTWHSFSDASFYAIAHHRPSGVGWLVGSEGRVARFVVPIPSRRGE